MKYRQHRGGYRESMATMVTVGSKKELLEHIKESIPEVTSIKVESYMYDERNKWDTHIVSGRIKGKHYPLGFTDGQFDGLH